MHVLQTVFFQENRLIARFEMHLKHLFGKHYGFAQHVMDSPRLSPMTYAGEGFICPGQDHTDLSEFILVPKGQSSHTSCRRRTVSVAHASGWLIVLPTRIRQEIFSRVWDISSRWISDIWII